ncbi:tetratricopeptide repeat protein [Fulvivirga sp. M361]|uniref:tetratricopeptide repeat protein n=1 Tax=Fulvivirga sp. M361 TaxID=2594266 RepID=UPI0016266204|nr:tetratricopeptide repeat protein [Fulvivirga sp. M361]
MFCSCSTHLGQGETYFEEGDYEKAEYHFTEALKMDANNWKIIYNLARCKEELGKYEEAVALYTRSMDWKVTVASHIGRARCFEKQDYTEGAIMDYNSALKINRTDNFEAYYGRGRCYIKEFKYHKAYIDMDRAIKIRPDYVNAYYHRSIARSQLRNNYGALKDMDYVLKHKKDFGQAYFNRGIILQRMGKYQKAKADFNKAIDLKLRSSDVFIRRGLCYYELGDRVKACKDFSYATRYNEDHAKRVIRKYCD